ncbi:GNAT family N-acetyltransferase [Paenibacillus senegalensis]|uniref:GNAT family N-acetyltransferase n=1 Tax=Paenibacillus senegalensis TaxID=1465766 RepID=UPI0002891C51|nr:GNAT family protein [Paenibacillus senegalensis]
MKVNIKTSRLLVRNFQTGDWQALYEYTSDEQVMKFLPEYVFTEQNAQHFVQKHSGDEARCFAVCLTDEQRLIGHISFHKHFGDHTYEIGWVFHPAYCNKGYATEAAKAMLRHGFEQLQLHRIIATCQPENIASHRVMEKIGMRREGFFKKCIPRGQEWWDEYCYAILREEWMDAIQRYT